VPGLNGVRDVATGHYSSIALEADGTVWTWGLNNFGQLGNGTTTTSTVPVRVRGLTDVIRIAGARDHSLAVKADGTVWAWGDNQFGNLGNGTTENSAVPIRVKGLTNVKFIAGGRDHSLAIERDGTVWAWGWNRYGQLGDGTKTDRLAPVRVGGLPAAAVQVAAGANHSVARLANGTVWAWGQNSFGQVGDGTGAGPLAPVKVPGIANAINVGAGRLH
jgi:alpha-tubulin suppressor-like RCC1 family protein